jgi:uridine kinase
LLQTPTQKPLHLVAIDGHSAAGKSSLARRIQQALAGVAIVHTDDFYRPLAETKRASLNAEGGYNWYYDWQRLEAQVLRPLSQGDSGRFQKYDWDANRLGGWAEVEAKGVILVEGCYAARPELRRYYDVVVLVRTSAELRAQRQQARADASPAWLERWDAAERYYMENQRPWSYADLVVAGT